MNVVVLGLGEAGSRYARGIVDHGLTVSAYDPADAVTPEGVTRAGSAPEAAAGAAFVLSLVGGHAAAAAARSVAAQLPPGAIYADMNAASPAVKAEIAAVVGSDRFADVSVIGPVPTTGIATSLIVSGAASSEAKRFFGALGAQVEDIGGGPGDASARKLLRSVFMKGLAALIVDTTAAGRAAGVEGWVRQQIAAELSGADAALDRLHDGTHKHAVRRAGELDAAIALLRSLGLPARLTDAVAEVHHRIADTALAPDDDVVAGFAGLAVANIGDARDRMGMLDSGIRTLYRGARLVGPARTVWVRSGDNQAVHLALADARRGDVLVINGQGDPNRALIGELIAERAKARGVVGMVIDGAVRDVVELERIGFPVWARGVSPAGPYKNGPGRVDVPVAVGGVVVCPDDIVAADDDGVIVVPAAEAVASARGARAVEAEEKRRRAAILAEAAG